jgi:hypothetical protein
MGNRFTRRRFLAAVGAGAAYFVLANTTGCESAERTSRAKPATRSQPTHPGRMVASGSSRSSSRRGAWTFRSRPDLSPPAVEVSKKARATAPGYIFLAPEKGYAGQGGSLIVDNGGQVVWFRPLQERYGRAMDFKAQTYRGRPVLTWMETGSGEYVICDHTYHEIARIGAGNGYEGDHHEFLISPQDTALITIYNRVPRDLSSVGGPKESVAVQGTVQEIDIESGEVLLEWHSLDHVALDESYAKPGEDIDSPGIDYFHLNSIDVDHDNNLLISARKTSAVYKIDRKSGEVIWRLGGKKSDFEMGEGTRFAFQHDARRLPDGTISIFDNGDTVFENGFPKVVQGSRAIVLDVDEKRMKASLAREYAHPDEHSTPTRPATHNSCPTATCSSDGAGRRPSRSSPTMASCSSISDWIPKTRPTGRSASRGAGSRANGLPWSPSAPRQMRCGSTPAGTVPRRSRAGRY